MNDASAVLENRNPYAILAMDGRDYLRSVPDGTFDLIFGSPPYEDARYYGALNFRIKGEEYVKWAVEFFELCLQKSKGLVAWVIDCKTKRYKYNALPLLIAADLHRRGACLRKPAAYYRVGVAGSGGPDWLRNDWEFILCATATRGKLPWSSNIACGHKPKWGPGGAMSHRMPDGKRVNEWGGTKSSTGPTRQNGKRQKAYRPGHKYTSKDDERKGQKNGSPRRPDGSRQDQPYVPPKIANPGNVIKQLYTAEDVAAILHTYGVEGFGDFAHVKVGGGLMGHPLSHKNEAPFSLDIAEFFVQSFCPPGGLVFDPFCGSGTTTHASILHGRRCISTEMPERKDQIQNALRRLKDINPLLPAIAPRALAIFDKCPMEPERVARWLEGHDLSLFDEEIDECAV